MGALNMPSAATSSGSRAACARCPAPGGHRGRARPPRPRLDAAAKRRRSASPRREAARRADRRGPQARREPAPAPQAGGAQSRPPARPQSPSAAAPARPSSSSAACSASVSSHSPRTALDDEQHAGRGRPAARGGGQHRRRLHLDRQRARLAPGVLEPGPRVVEEVGGDDRAGRRHVRPQRAQQRLVRRDTSPAPARGSPRRGEHALGRDAGRRGRRPVERPARPDAHEAPGAQLDQLLDDDRRARAAHAGALDREQLAVGRLARVAPQAAVVVEHLRRVEQRLGHPERPAGVAGEEHPLGDRCVRLAGAPSRG